jgi:hypothetical protein
MAWASERLEYLRGFMSRGEIQSETGIHWKTQEAILGGRQELDSSYNNPLRNLYARTTYNNMRSTGFSVSQSTRFRYSEPGGVTQKITMVSTLIRDLAVGSLRSQLDREDRVLTSTQYARALTARIEDVYKGFKTSWKTFEQWMDEYSARLKKVR